jgi:hypothetical protein
LHYRQGVGTKYKADKNKNTIAQAMVFNRHGGLMVMNYFSAGRFLPVGLFTTLDLSPSVTILRWLEILWSSPRI